MTATDRQPPEQRTPPAQDGIPCPFCHPPKGLRGVLSIAFSASDLCPTHLAEIEGVHAARPVEPGAGEASK